MKSALLSFLLASVLSCAGREPSLGEETDVRAMAGSQWTYEAIDEITGTKALATVVVTEVTPNEVIVRSSYSTNPSAFATVVYDHDWNVVEGNRWKYSPHSGSGLQRPLTTDSAWSAEADASWQQQTGWSEPIKFKTSSRVLGSEKLTTPAGIAPKIDHYVRLTEEVRVQGRLQQKSSQVLQKYVLK
jgi:hypothetical protein